VSNRGKDNSYLDHGGELLVSDPYDVNEFITGRDINYPAN